MVQAGTYRDWIRAVGLRVGIMVVEISCAICIEDEAFDGTSARHEGWIGERGGR